MTAGLVDTLLQQRALREARDRELIQQDRGIEHAATSAVIGNIEEELPDLMLNVETPGVNARRFPEVVREHIDIIEVADGRIDQRRRPEARRRSEPFIPWIAPFTPSER